MYGAIPLLYNTLSCHGAQLKKAREQLYLYFYLTPLTDMVENDR